MKTGQCECGQVSYKSPGPWRDVIACHCRACRRTSGHYWAATAVPMAALELKRVEGLQWFRASSCASRGFCSGCGSSMFYKHDDKDYIAIAAGSLDQPTGLKMTEEAFTGEKGDYYPLCENTLHSDTWSDNVRASGKDN